MPGESHTAKISSESLFFFFHYVSRAFFIVLWLYGGGSQGYPWLVFHLRKMQWVCLLVHGSPTDSSFSDCDRLVHKQQLQINEKILNSQRNHVRILLHTFSTSKSTPVIPCHVGSHHPRLLGHTYWWYIVTNVLPVLTLQDQAIPETCFCFQPRQVRALTSHD